MADGEQLLGFQFKPHTATSTPHMATSTQNQHAYYYSYHEMPPQQSSESPFNAPCLSAVPSAVGSSPEQRQTYSGSNSLVMAPWPSQINSHTLSTYQPQITQVQRSQHMTLSGPYLSFCGTLLQPVPTPRRSMSDADRRDMCLYADTHPNSKQREIGALFGVERSAVSRVLRKRENYSVCDDQIRLQTKRTKRRPSNSERTLAMCNINRVSSPERPQRHVQVILPGQKGLPPLENVLCDRAHASAPAADTPMISQAVTANTSANVKLVSGAIRARSRKGSLAPRGSVPKREARPLLSAAWNSNTTRLRSQDTPSSNQHDDMQASSEATTPKSDTVQTAGSRMEEGPDSGSDTSTVCKQVRCMYWPASVHTVENMRLMPVPLHVSPADARRDTAQLQSATHAVPGPVEALRAMEEVLSFIMKQGSGYLNN